MKTILIVEDEKYIRDFMTEILVGEGYYVYESENGKQALSLLEQNDFDLIITDIIMEDIDGLELIGKIKSNKNKDLKIIAISGGGVIGADKYLHIALKMGADSIIEKPFTGEDLLKVINEFDIKKAWKMMPN